MSSELPRPRTRPFPIPLSKSFVRASDASMARPAEGVWCCPSALKSSTGISPEAAWRSARCMRWRAAASSVRRSSRRLGRDFFLVNIGGDLAKCLIKRGPGAAISQGVQDKFRLRGPGNNRQLGPRGLGGGRETAELLLLRGRNGAGQAEDRSVAYAEYFFTQLGAPLSPGEGVSTAAPSAGSRLWRKRIPLQIKNRSGPTQDF